MHVMIREIIPGRQNGLQLNPDKSEVLAIGTATQLQAATSTVSPASTSPIQTR